MWRYIRAGPCPQGAHSLGKRQTHPQTSTLWYSTGQRREVSAGSCESHAPTTASCVHAYVCACVCGGGRGSYRIRFTGVLIFELSLEGVSQMAKDHRSHSYSLYNSLYLVAFKDTQ